MTPEPHPKCMLLCSKRAESIGAEHKSLISEFFVILQLFSPFFHSFFIMPGCR
jgi:hypothetical protein